MAWPAETSCTLLYTALGARDFPKEEAEIYVDGKGVVVDNCRSREIYGGKDAGVRTTVQDKGPTGRSWRFSIVSSWDRESRR